MKINIILMLIVGLVSNSYAKVFDIEAFAIGPNPFIRGGNKVIVVNYYANELHRAEYYGYSITGERLFFEKKDIFETQSVQGIYRYKLNQSIVINNIGAQLVVLIARFISANDTVTERSYIVVK